MKILLAITGSISCYKMAELVRLLVKNGDEVRCIFSKSAEEFINPNLFKYLGATQVYRAIDDFKPQLTDSATSPVLHIELAQWCDKFIIAPITANTIAKLNAGICDDLLSSVFLSIKDRTIILAPAMNTNMLENPITENNLANLKLLNNLIILDTVSGLLACGTTGPGKLISIDKIYMAIQTINLPLKHLKNQKKYLISSGASVSPLDPVRYLTNPSSGKTGYFFAIECLKLGHNVTLVTGPNANENISDLLIHPNFKLIKSTTTSKLKNIILEEFIDSDYYISAAAFCDIEFDIQENKIKKTNLDGQLKYKIAPDILKEVLALKKPHQKVIGFAAESSADEALLINKWNQKPVDILVGNIVNSGHDKNELIGFKVDDGHYILVKNGTPSQSQHLTKTTLAAKIISELECH